MDIESKILSVVFIMLQIIVVLFLVFLCILGTFIILEEINTPTQDQYITCTCGNKVNFTDQILPLFTDEVKIDRNLIYYSIECKCGRKWSVNFKEE